MPLRKIGRALASIFRDLSGMGNSLLTIKQQGSTIIMKLDDLKAASTAEASAVSSVLATVLALQAQHQDDLAKLAALTPSDDNSGEIAALTAAMQERAKDITDALTTLHAQTSAASGSDTVSGAGSDTISGGAADTTSGGTASDTVSGGTGGAVTGADTVTGAGGNTAL